MPENRRVSSLDWALAGQCAHFMVLAAVAVGLTSCVGRVLEQPPTSRQRLAWWSLLVLFGGAFRMTPLGTTGRLSIAGAALVISTGLAVIGFLPSMAAVARRVAGSAGPARWFLLYGLAAAPSVATATDPLAAAGGAAGLVALGLVAVALGVNFDSGQIRRLLGSLAVAAVVVAMSSAALTSADSFQQIRSPMLNWRFLGWFPFVELGWGHLGVGFVIIGLERARWRWPSVGVGLLLIGATQARGAAIAAAVVGVIWVGLAHRRRLPAMVAASVVATVLLVAVQPVRDLWDREQAVVESDSIFSYRSEFVRAAFEVWKDSPVVGRGIDSGTVDDFSAELTIGRPDLVTSTHMTWTTAIAGTGAVGLALLVITIASAWRWAVRQFRWSGERVPVLVMAWVTASSFFVVGPAELSTLGLVFAVGVVAPSLADGRNSPPAAHGEDAELSWTVR